MSIPFTQYKLPHGIKEEVTCTVENEKIEKMAEELISKGCVFECEILRNGLVSLECLREDEDEEITSYAVEITENDESVNDKVVRLVKNAHKSFFGSK